MPFRIRAVPRSIKNIKVENMKVKCHKTQTNLRRWSSSPSSVFLTFFSLPLVSVSHHAAPGDSRPFLLLLFLFFNLLEPFLFSFFFPAAAPHLHSTRVSLSPYRMSLLVCFYVIFEHLCVCFCVCRRRDEGWRHPQALPSIYPSQETPSPKDKLLLHLPSPAPS